MMILSQTVVSAADLCRPRLGVPNCTDNSRPGMHLSWTVRRRRPGFRGSMIL